MHGANSMKDIIRQRAQVADTNGWCCFCGQEFAVAEMVPRPAEAWGVGLPFSTHRPAASSPLCCRHCKSRGKDAASKRRLSHGLIGAEDLDHWPYVAVSEFATKLLAMLERPPVDSTGFYPGRLHFASRPVTKDDLFMHRSARGQRGAPSLPPSPVRPRPNSKERKRNKSVNFANAAEASSVDSKEVEPEVPLVWRADWADLHEAPVGSKPKSPPHSPKVKAAVDRSSTGAFLPLDWSSLDIIGGAAPPVEHVDELWRLADISARRSRLASRLIAEVDDTAGLIPPSTGDEGHSRGSQSRGSYSRSSNRSYSSHPPSRSGDSSFDGGLSSGEPSLGSLQHSSVTSLKSAGNSNKVSARQAHHAADALGLLLPGKKATIPADSREAAIIAAATAEAAAAAGGGDNSSSDNDGSNNSGDGLSNEDRAVPTPMLPSWADVQPAGGPLRVDCVAVPPGRFFFPNHGAALACLLQLTRRFPKVKALVRNSIPALVERAVRCPLRSHTVASRASLYLLCSLAPDFRQDLGKCQTAEAVLRSLIAEESLAATIIQLYARKKSARVAAALREEKTNKDAADAEKGALRLKVNQRRQELREARWAKEKAARLDWKASGKSDDTFVEMTPEEEAAADRAEEVQATADVESDTAKNNEKKKRGSSRGGGKEKLNQQKEVDSFAQRAKLMNQFHRAHTREMWAKMEHNAKVVAEESYLRIWVGCARGVLNADKKGKSDPYAVLTTRDLGSSSGKSIELHRTRVIDDSLDPNFNEWCTFLMPPSWSNALKKLQQRQNDKVNDDDVASKGSVSNDGDNYDDRYPDNIEINIALNDYDEVGRNDPLGTATLILRWADVDAHMQFMVLPLMLKTKYRATNEEDGSLGERLKVEKGEVHVGVCMDEGASRVSSEVNTDDFRGSIKLLALLTEPGDANGGYAQRHARYLALEGGAVPLLSAFTGEFSDNDLRIQEIAARALLHLAAVPPNRPLLLKLVPEAISLLQPRVVVTANARVNVLYFLGLLAIPFLGTDEKVPNVSLKAEAAAKRRATIRCAKELATPTALAAYRTLLVDLAQPAITGNYEPPSLSQSELRMVDALLELLVRITAYDSRPTPATLFIRLVMDKAKPETYTNWGDGQNDNEKSSAIVGAASASADSSSSPENATDLGGGEATLPGGMESAEVPPATGLLLSARESNAMQDMRKLGPLLQTLLSLLGEPERGIDEDAVTLLQQVMKHNYEIDNVSPPVIAIQGVVDPNQRHELEETIVAFGCEWREPDFLAPVLSDILADDVTHLYEGPFIGQNGRTPKEAACFQDATAQGCVLLNSDESLVAVLQGYEEKVAAMAPVVHLEAFDIDDWLLLSAAPLPPVVLPLLDFKDCDLSSSPPSAAMHADQMGRGDDGGVDDQANTTASALSRVFGMLREASQNGPPSGEVGGQSSSSAHVNNNVLHSATWASGAVCDEAIRQCVMANEQARIAREELWLSKTALGRRTAAALHVWSLTLSAHDHEQLPPLPSSTAPHVLLSSVVRTLVDRCAKPDPNTPINATPQSSRPSTANPVASKTTSSVLDAFASSSSNASSTNQEKASSSFSMTNIFGSGRRPTNSAGFPPVTASMPPTPKASPWSLATPIGTPPTTAPTNDLSAIDKDDNGVAHKAQPALHSEDLLSGIATESDNANKSDLHTSQPAHSQTEASLAQEDEGDPGTDWSNSGINAGSHDELNEASEAELLNDLVAAGSDIIGAKAFIKAQGRKRSPSINPFGTARGGGSPAAAAAGSGVTSAGSRWKRAQQRVSVLSAALGKRRQQMLNHNKTAGGEDSKSHDGKNIPSGSCAEGNSPDTIQGRGRSVARTTCLLDTLIALMTSPCLVQPLDRARALLWCHSILDMLIPKKKTAAATSINAESGAGNEIGQEETEERSSRAPGQCRLLIVHAAAAALTDLPALLVRRFCAKLVSKTDVQTAGSEEESLRDATRRSEIATSSDQVDDDEMLRIEIREEAAFAVAEALHRLEKRSGLASADEAKKASNVFHPNDSSSSNSTSSKGKFCSSGWHRPEKVEWWEDLGLCLRSLQTACHLLVETSIRDPSSNDNNKSSSKGSNSGHDSCLGGANPDEGNGVNGNNWPNELVMRRYVQMLLGDRDLTPASVSHTTIDALFDASARLAGRAPPMVGITSFSRKDRPSSVADLQGSVPAGSDGKGVGVKKAQQKAQVAAVSPPHVAEAPPTFQKASANLAYVLSTVAMVVELCGDAQRQARMASARAQAMEQAIRRGAQLRLKGANWIPPKRQTYFGEAPSSASGKKKKGAGNGGGNSGNSSSSGSDNRSMMAAEVLVLDAIPPSGGYMRIHDDDDNLDNNSGTNENSPAGSRHSSRPGTADGSQRNATNSQQAAQLGSPGREASNLSTRNNRRSRPGTPQQVRFGDGSRPGTPLLSEQNNHNNNKAAAVVPVGTTAADASASLTPEETKAIAYWHQAFVAAAAEADAARACGACATAVVSHHVLLLRHLAVQLPVNLWSSSSSSSRQRRKTEAAAASGGETTVGVADSEAQPDGSEESKTSTAAVGAEGGDKDAPKTEEVKELATSSAAAAAPAAAPAQASSASLSPPQRAPGPLLPAVSRANNFSETAPSDVSLWLGKGGTHVGAAAAASNNNSNSNSNNESALPVLWPPFGSRNVCWPPLRDAPMIGACLALLRDGTSGLQDGGARLLEDVLLLAPHPVAACLTDPNIAPGEYTSAIACLGEAASPDALPSSYFVLLRALSWEYTITRSTSGKYSGRGMIDGHPVEEPWLNLVDLSPESMEAMQRRAYSTALQSFYTVPSVAAHEALKHPRTSGGSLLTRPNTALRVSSLDVHLAAAPVLLQCCVNHFLKGDLTSLLMLQPQATSELLKLFADLIHTPLSQPHRVQNYTPGGAAGASAEPNEDDEDEDDGDGTSKKKKKKKKHKGPSHECLADHIVATEEMFRRCCELLRGPNHNNAQQNTAIDLSQHALKRGKHRGFSGSDLKDEARTVVDAEAEGGKTEGGASYLASPMLSPSITSARNLLRPMSASSLWSAARAAAHEEASYHVLTSSVHRDCGGPLRPPPFNRLGHVVLVADSVQALDRGLGNAIVYGKESKAVWLKEVQRAEAPFGKYYPKTASSSSSSSSKTQQAKKKAKLQKDNEVLNRLLGLNIVSPGVKKKSSKNKDKEGNRVDIEVKEVDISSGGAGSGVQEPFLMTMEEPETKPATPQLPSLVATPPLSDNLPLASPLQAPGDKEEGALEWGEGWAKAGEEDAASEAAAVADAVLSASRTSSQLMIDEGGCAFLCRAIGAEPFTLEVHSHEAEFDAPKLSRSGAIEALALVTRRWPHGGYHNNNSSSSSIGKSSSTTTARPLDGRLAHHYAVNALVSLSQLSRGKHRRQVAGAGCGVALRLRLEAMKKHAVKAHNTDYSKQAAMAAIEDVLRQKAVIQSAAAE